MDHFEGTFQGHGGVELYYQRWRPVATPKAALVVLHGFGEHSGRYGNVVDWFLPRGYVVYAFDMRGHGRSPGQRGYIESYAELRDDLRALLDVIRGEERAGAVFLLGHSQGALTALNYALHDPTELAGVIASGPTLDVDLPVSPVLIWLAKILSNIWPTFTLEVGLDATALSRDTAVVEAYVDDPLVHGKGTSRLGTEVMAAIDWTQAHAAELALPCLIVQGSDDRLAAPKASQTFFENVTYADKERIEYDGYYHEVFNEPGKDKVLADVEAWLERHL